MMHFRRLFVSAILLIGLAAIAYGQLVEDVPEQAAAAVDRSDAGPQSGNHPQTVQPVKLEILAQIGPWPVASRMIGYRGRLWFANSVKGRNHNSADIWSLDPATGEKRYERYLVSQDAGTPLVYKGLLYWPFEDALLSFGNGVIEVTDGEAWQTLNIPHAPIYHTSQLFAWQGDLLAITGTRNAGIQRSDNAGRSWTEDYIHPTPSTHVSRLKEMTVFKGALYGALSDAKVKRLSVWTGSGFRTVKGWPLNRYFNGLVVHRDALFGIVGRGAAREIWKYDGRKAVQVGETGAFVDLASDGKNLWVVSRGGHLWSSSHGAQWVRHDRLEKGRPVSIAAIDGAIFVAGSGDDGRGIVWGPRHHALSPGSRPPPVIRQMPSATTTPDWPRLGAEMDRLLADRATYESRGSSALRALIYQAATSGAPPGFFAQRMTVVIPGVTVEAFGGAMRISAGDLAHRLLLWGMALSGEAEIPVQSLTTRWTSPPNAYEKYFERGQSALRAVAATGQNDPATIAALIQRLDFADDPSWLRSQVIGTLTAISGQHFGYDVKAWKAWARAERQGRVQSQ